MKFSARASFPRSREMLQGFLIRNALLIFGVFVSLSAAEDRWVTLRSDSFELFTDAGARTGRAELVRLEQFRFALGKIVGKPDMALHPPGQVFLFKTSKEAARF